MRLLFTLKMSKFYWKRLVTLYIANLIWHFGSSIFIGGARLRNTTKMSLHLACEYNIDWSCCVFTKRGRWRSLFASSCNTAVFSMREVTLLSFLCMWPELYALKRRSLGRMEIHWSAFVLLQHVFSPPDRHIVLIDDFPWIWSTAFDWRCKKIFTIQSC